MFKISIKPVAIASVASLAILWIGSAALRYNLDFATCVPLYLLLVLTVAWTAGFGAAVTVSVASTLCLDYFLTLPRFTLRVASRHNVLALISFASVSLLVTQLSKRLRADALALKHGRQQQQALHEFARSASLLDWKAPVCDQLCAIVQDRFHLNGVGLWDARSEAFSYVGTAADTSEATRAVFLARRDYDLTNSGELIRLLRYGARPLGAVLFRGSSLDAATASALAALIGSAMERARALRAEVLAESAKVSEQLRAAVLDGLAHAFKTPLTTIAISGAGILELGGLSPVQRQLADTIGEQVSHLALLTDKLLRTSLLSNGEIVPHRHTLDVRLLCQRAIQQVTEAYDATRVQASYPREQMLFDGDEELLQLAMVQLLDNAFKYSPAATPVLLQATQSPGAIVLSVYNQASYIAPAEHALIFERFYRSPSVERCAPGTGIGLSVARRAVEAHDGSIAVDSERSSGTTFRITLPLQESHHVQWHRSDR